MISYKIRFAKILLFISNKLFLYRMYVKYNIYHYKDNKRTDHNPDIMSGVFYTHPLVYNLIFVLIDGCFWGLLNCAVLWAVNFLRNITGDKLTLFTK